jgi:phosphoglycolate phosphatase
VREALGELHAAGTKMAILTNKPVNISRAIIDGLGVASFFFQIYGGNSFDQKKPHPMGVEVLLAEARTEQGKTLLVGDSSVDIRTARNAGIACVGCTWGFQPESLVIDPPDWLIEQMTELPAIVRNPPDAII